MTGTLRAEKESDASRGARLPGKDARMLASPAPQGERSAWAVRYERLPLEDAARNFADPRTTSELTAAYQQAGSVEERREILEGLAGRADAQARRLLGEAARTGTAELRIAALEALVEGAGLADLAATASALEDDRTEVRAAGVWLLGAIPAEDSLGNWKRALADHDAEVTELAFDRVRQMPMAIQVDAAIEAARSVEGWRAERAIVLLGSLPSKKAVEALIGLIDHRQSGDLAQDGLFFLLGEMFASRAEAFEWWSANRESLDEVLNPLNP